MSAFFFFSWRWHVTVDIMQHKAACTLKTRARAHTCTQSLFTLLFSSLSHRQTWGAIKSAEIFVSTPKTKSIPRTRALNMERSFLIPVPHKWYADVITASHFYSTERKKKRWNILIYHYQDASVTSLTLILLLTYDWWMTESNKIHSIEADLMKFGMQTYVKECFL